MESSKEVFANVNGAFQLRCSNIGRHRPTQYDCKKGKGLEVGGCDEEENEGSRAGRYNVRSPTASGGATRTCRKGLSETVGSIGESRN